jgi:hypothetical protein
MTGPEHAQCKPKPHRLGLRRAMPFLSVYGGPSLTKRARASVSAIETLSEQCAAYCLRVCAVLAHVGLGGEPVRPIAPIPWCPTIPVPSGPIGALWGLIGPSKPKPPKRLVSAPVLVR